MELLQGEEGEVVKPLTPIQRRLIEANSSILGGEPDRSDFLHTVMCQVGMPRRATPARTFERTSGPFSVSLEAGRLWNGQHWIDQPLPYGSTPRLVMVYLSSEAVRTRSRNVELGSSMRQFLGQLGMNNGGGARGGYGNLQRQMSALAACRLTLGMQTNDRVVTIDSKPIRRFEAWLSSDGVQHSLWPAMIELSQDFYDTLVEHAVPLDYRALAAIKHSALALDVYTWLAHRLCRIRKPEGTKVSWQNLRDQFGQEYASHKDFKREFRDILRQVWMIYPDAQVEETIGGIHLWPSRPPIQKTRFSLSRVTKLSHSTQKGV